MEHGGSLPCSQELTTGFYSEPDASSPQIPTLFPQDPFQYYLLSTSMSSKSSLPVRPSNQNFVRISDQCLDFFVRQRSLMTGYGLVIHGKRIVQNTCYLWTSMVMWKIHLRERSGSTHRYVALCQLYWVLCHNIQGCTFFLKLCFVITWY
jgi:hypothetical protein